jgi:hypothetical protein
LCEDNNHLKAVFVLKSKTDADVFAEKTIATYETQYRDNPMAKPQEITLTITNKHLFGKAFVCEQIATMEEDIFYSRFTANIADITKISINTYIKELPIYVSFERPNKKNKNAKDRKRIILPGFEHPENIVAQITESKDKLLNFNRNYADSDEVSDKKLKRELKEEEHFERMSKDYVAEAKPEPVTNTDALLCGEDKIKSADEITYDNNVNEKATEINTDTIKMDAEDALLDIIEEEVIDTATNEKSDAEAFSEPDISSESLEIQPEVNATASVEATDKESDEKPVDDKTTGKLNNKRKPPVAPAPPAASAPDPIEEATETSRENTYIEDYTYLARTSDSDTEEVQTADVAETFEELILEETSNDTLTVVIADSIIEQEILPQAETVSPDDEKEPEKVSDKTETTTSGIENLPADEPKKAVNNAADNTESGTPEKSNSNNSQKAEVKTAEKSIADDDETPAKMTLDEFEQAMRKLKIMKETNVISDEEYTSEKKRILKTLY